MLLSVEIFNNMNLQGRNVQLWLRDAALRMEERMVGPGGVTQESGHCGEHPLEMVGG